MSALVKVVEINSTKGRGVIAECSIEPDALVLSVPCDISVLYTPYVRFFCDHCFSRLSGFSEKDCFVCGKCQQFALCPSCCQEKYLKAHVEPCAWFMQLDEHVREGDTDYLRFLLKYASLVQNGDMRAALAIAECCTNEDSQDPEVKQFCRSYSKLTTSTFAPYGLVIDEESLYLTLLRVKSNALGFPFDEAEVFGWAMQEEVCMLNHSCVPNCSVHVGRPEGKIELRTLKEIKEGEELTISYLNLQEHGSDVQTRSKSLLSKYRFLCKCELCEEQRKQLREKS